MRDEAIAIVERGVGQKVRAFLGDVSPAEGVAVAVFLLEPSTITLDGSDAVRGDGASAPRSSDGR